MGASSQFPQTAQEITPGHILADFPGDKWYCIFRLM